MSFNLDIDDVKIVELRFKSAIPLYSECPNCESGELWGVYLEFPKEDQRPDSVMCNKCDGLSDSEELKKFKEEEDKRSDKEVLFEIIVPGAFLKLGNLK